jgi:type II secretory pathway pseudopilin PulG
MRKDNNKGFTFVELILYMGILGIFMVAVLSLVSSTVASSKKQKSVEKLQTQATETYDSISDMLMGASSVKIYGDAYLSDGSGSYSKVTGANFIVPEDTYIKNDVGQKLLTSGGVSGVTQQVCNNGSLSKVMNADASATASCYDIADIKAFGGVDASTDAETFVEAKYLWIEYASTLDTISFCTIKYDNTAKKLYINRVDVKESDYEQLQTDLASDDVAKKNSAQTKLTKYNAYTDSTSTEGTVLANNVSNFQLQVNPDDDSVAVVIEFEDSKTGEDYKVTGVVGLRNSFVLKKHEWTK